MFFSSKTSKTLLTIVATFFVVNTGIVFAQTAEQMDDKTAEEISRAKRRHFLGLDETEQEKKAKQQKQKAAFAKKKKPKRECTQQDLDYHRVASRFFNNTLNCYMPADGKVKK